MPWRRLCVIRFAMDIEQRSPRRAYTYNKIVMWISLNVLWPLSAILPWHQCPLIAAPALMAPKFRRSGFSCCNKYAKTSWRNNQPLSLGELTPQWLGDWIESGSNLPIFPVPTSRLFENGKPRTTPFVLGHGYHPHVLFFLNSYMWGW